MTKKLPAYRGPCCGCGHRIPSSDSHQQGWAPPREMSAILPVPDGARLCTNCRNKMLSMSKRSCKAAVQHHSRAKSASEKSKSKQRGARTPNPTLRQVQAFLELIGRSTNDIEESAGVIHSATLKFGPQNILPPLDVSCPEMLPQRNEIGRLRSKS